MVLNWFGLIVWGHIGSLVGIFVVSKSVGRGGHGQQSQIQDVGVKMQGLQIVGPQGESLTVLKFRKLNFS